VETSFPHPKDGSAVTVHAPVPADIRCLMEKAFVEEAEELIKQI
jgi:hypothetical protein